MRFLCLHGRGTNNHVFQTQSATIRYEMDKHHQFEFVEGTIQCPIAPEIKNVFPSRDTYFRYFWDTTEGAESLSVALDQLSTFVQAEGPFDGAFAFSHGGCLLATYLIRLSQQEAPMRPPFRCAIFLSSIRPFDPQALERGVMQLYEPKRASESPIKIPTAHIWGQEDADYAAQSDMLLGYCDGARRVAYVHTGGHEIPGPRAKSDVQGAVRAIRRTIDRAETEV